MNNTRITKLNTVICKAFFVCWIICMVVLSPGVYEYLPYKHIPMFLAFVGAVISCLTYRFIQPKIENWSRFKYTFVFALLVIVSLILLLYSGKILLTRPINDQGTVYYSAVEVIQNGSVSREINEYSCCSWSTHTSNNEYFLIYPRSLFLVAYLYPYLKAISSLLGVDLYSQAGLYSAVVFNCIHIAVSNAAISLAVQKIRGKAAGISCFVLSLFFLPNHLNTFKVYSDTLSMPYMSLAFLALICGKKSSNRWYMVLSGAFIALSILIKGSAWVLFVAAIVYLAFNSDYSEKGKLTVMLSKVAVICVTVFAIINLWNVFYSNCYWIDKAMADRYELPTMHWIMMASEGDGGYRQKALDYSLSYETKEARARADKDKFIEVVQSHGSFLAFMKEHVYKKICDSLADGRYYQQVHMDQSFMEDEMPGRILNCAGEYYNVLVRLLTGGLLFIYIGLFVATILAIKKPLVDEIFLIDIIFFGLLIFFCFWEFKSRYLMNFTPLYLAAIVLAADDFNSEVINALIKRFVK